MKKNIQKNYYEEYLTQFKPNFLRNCQFDEKEQNEEDNYFYTGYSQIKKRSKQLMIKIKMMNYQSKFMRKKGVSIFPDTKDVQKCGDININIQLRMNNNLMELLTQTKYLFSEDRNYEAHRKKINSIMNKNNASMSNKRTNLLNAFYSTHDRASRYSEKGNYQHYQARQEAMEKQNDMMLKKIISVNNRKNQQVHPQKNLSHNNLVNLKKSIQTIDSQNQKLAQKLVETTSKLTQDKFNESYRKHLQRKERLTKYAYDEEAGLIIPKKIKSVQKMRTLDPISTDRYPYHSRASENNQQDK